MKLVLYDEETSEIKSTIEEVNNPVVEDNNVNWEGGFLHGIKLPFLLLENDVEIGEAVDENDILLDKKAEYPFVDLKKENKILKDENRMNAMAIMELAQVMMGGV